MGMNRTPDLQNFFILRKVSTNYVKLEDGFDLSSDHSLIILTLSKTILSKENKPVLTNHTTDWDGFREIFDKTIVLNIPLKTVEQLNLEVEEFVADLQQAAWNNTKEITRKTVENNYSQEICTLVKEKRKVRWQ